MRKLNKTLLSVGASVLLSSVSLSSKACDLHDTGFGAFGHQGGFGMSHPMLQRRMSAPAPSQLKLEHARIIDATVEQKQSLDIKYHLPAEYENASLRFTNSEGLSLDTQESVAIDELNGVYTLDFVAKEAGKNHILVWVDAVKQTLPYSKVQRIEIDVQ